MMERTETEGLLSVGEINVVVRRDSPREMEFTEAIRQSRVTTLTEIAAYVLERRERAGMYEDVRALDALQIHLADKIRLTQA